MSELRSAPIATPRAQRRDDFRRRTLPALVWGVSLLAVLGLLLARASRTEHVGLAQSLEYIVSPVTTGTLESVVVDLYETVNAGDMLAKLDDEAVLASIETANATVRKLQADLDATRAQLVGRGGEGHANRTADLRRFQMDEEQRRLEALALRVEIETDLIEFERLEVEARRAEQLRDAGLVSQAEFDIARTMRNQVRQRLEDNRVLFEQLEAEHHVARQRRSEFEDSLPSASRIEPLLQPLRAAIDVESRRIEEIELARRALVLRSPVNGQITQILCRKGQSVVAGEPIITVAEDSVREIVAYLDEVDGRAVRPNMPVVVSTRQVRGTVSDSVVLRVGPSVQQMPQRLWRDPRVPDYGRAVVVAAAPGMKLTPGELVNIEILESR